MAVSFRTKLLASHVALVVAVGAIAIFTLNRSLTADLVRQLDQRLEEQARGASEWAGEGGRRHPEKMATRIANIVDAEVTIFERDGTVLGASTTDARADVGPEVSEARATSVGRGSRPRGGQEFHYVAVRGTDGLVLRLAVPLSEVKDTVEAMRSRLIFASLTAVGAALALGFLAARIASRPLGEMTATATRLAQGDFDVPIPTDAQDEFGVLWRALKSLAQQLKARIGELVAERDQLSAILAGMQEGVLVLDRTGRVLVANPAAARILGRPSDIVGGTLEDLVTIPAIRELVESGMRGEVTETEIEAADARGQSLIAYVRPLKHSGGAVVAVLRDMTALRRLMTMRRDFVANVSHELRTPVTAIQGYAETLLRGGLDEDTKRQFLEIVHRQGQRIGALVEQLLALSELEVRDPDAVVRETLELLPIATHVAETVRNRAEARRAKVELDVPPDTLALADPEGLERALLNLVDNAVKYGKDGGTVRVSASTKDMSVAITVADDGPGIAAEHLPRLFERFYRVDPGRARAHGGTGLGLAIVRHLVESMGGAVTVESEVGRGTRFVLTVPRP